MRRAVPLVAVAALVLTACAQTVTPQVDPLKTVPAARGVALTAYAPDAYAKGTAALDRVKALGARDVEVIPRWQMATRTASTVTPEADSPTEQDVLTGVRAAKARGLRVLVKPHLDVRDGTFRGDIAPGDRDAWWEDYRVYVLRFARVAAAGGADAFSVGTELSSMSGDEARWRALIAEVRRIFGGALLFAANWDAVDRVGFWDALDAIGLDAYFPLEPDDPAASWVPVRRTLAKTARRWQRPVVFTEVGYPSEHGAASHPFSERGGEPDEEGQAELYRAVFAAFRTAGWWRGAYWWDWRVDGTVPTPTGYEPTGKLAERALRDGWR